MKRLLLTVAACALLSTSASAYEVTCGAPQMLFNLDRSPDLNPVVKVEVRYEPSEHQWRVFHTLADGRVVSRSEQYSVTDASDTNIAQWQGSHGKMRHLFMIGEVKRGPKGIEYHEWQYNRNTNTMLFESVSLCRAAAPVVAMSQPSQRSQPDIVIERRPEPRQQVAAVFYFQADRDVPLRDGPGSNHNLVGAVPAGAQVNASRCVQRDDGIAGADWCLVSFRGITGWGSRANLMPIN